MKIVEGFKMRRLGSDIIVVGEGLAQVNFNKMISLNASAAYLWESVDGKEFDVDDLVRLLLKKYEVAEDVARRDAERLVQTWKDAGLVE